MQVGRLTEKQISLCDEVVEKLCLDKMRANYFERSRYGQKMNPVETVFVSQFETEVKNEKVTKSDIYTYGETLNEFKKTFEVPPGLYREQNFDYAENGGNALEDRGSALIAASWTVPDDCIYVK